MANTPLNKVRVLIVDDSAFMRKVLETILISDPQLQVIGHAKDAREAVALAESLKPNVMTMYINMPHMDGLQATAQIKLGIERWCGQHAESFGTGRYRIYRQAEQRY